MWHIVINGPGYFDTRYEVMPGVTHVGRADENEVVLSGDLVSRRHGRLHTEGGSLSWEDLGSRNGSLINGERSEGTTGLAPGDVVTVGENSLRIEHADASASASPDSLHLLDAGGIRRFGSGSDIAASVVAARSLSDSKMLQSVDERVPFETQPPTKAGKRHARATSASEPGSSALEAPEEVGASTARPPPLDAQSLALFFRVAEQLAMSPTLQSFLDATCDLLMKRVGATTAVVLLKHASDVLLPVAIRHSGRLQQGEVPVSDAVVAATLAQARALAVSDVHDDSRFAERDSVVLYGVDQVLCVPIGPAPSLGVLYLNRSASSLEPLETLLDTCVAIAQLVQTGIQKFQGRPASADGRLKETLERFHGPEQLATQIKALQGAPTATRLEELHGTVLAIELVGLTEALAGLSPDALSELLNLFHRTVTQLVFSFSGTMVRATGDAALAFFGGSTAKGDAAIRAVRTALTLKTDWEIALARASAQGPARMALRCGLHSGKVLLGLTGFGTHLDLVLLGETAAVASLLCASADADQLLMTGKTLAVVGARFDVTPLGERALSGSKLRTPAFEVLDEDSDSNTMPGQR